MGGVGQCDQLLSSYSLNRKSVKWWKKVFFRMLEVTVVNSKHLHALLHPEQSNSRLHKQFREKLVHEMVQQHLDEKANPVPAVNPNENRLIIKHFAESKCPQRNFAILVRIRKMLRADNQEKNLQFLQKML